MGGLALGTFAASRRAATLPPRRALALYGLLELAVGITALGVAPALTARPANPGRHLSRRRGRPALRHPPPRHLPDRRHRARHADGRHLPARPALAGAAAQRTRRARRPDRRPLLRGPHFGAALGAAVTGFLLLPTLGLQRSTIAGVIINMIVGGCAYALQWRHRVDDGPAWTHDGTSPRSGRVGGLLLVGVSRHRPARTRRTPARRARSSSGGRSRSQQANDRSGAPPLRSERMVRARASDARPP